MGAAFPAREPEGGSSIKVLGEAEDGIKVHEFTLENGMQVKQDSLFIRRAQREEGVLMFIMSCVVVVVQP